MLLDEVFGRLARLKISYIRKDGELRKVMQPQKMRDLPRVSKPMFPISKPRYPDRDHD